MSDLPSLLLAVTRVAGNAETTLQTLIAALDEGDFDRARAALERYIDDAGALLEGVQATQARPPAVREAATEPELELRRWLRSFSKLFTEWLLEDAERLAERPPPELPARLVRAPAIVRGGTRAARAGRHSDARDMLDFLLRAHDASSRPRNLVSASRRALLLVYLGRIHLFLDRDPERASDAFAAAARLAPDHGIVHAALGSLYQARGDAAQALAAYQHAITEGPALPDGYVGMGRLAVADGRYDEAADWYRRALDVVEGAGFGFLGRLFAPVPPGLEFACGQRVASADPTAALRHFESALNGPEPPDAGLRARVEVARGEVLADLGSSEAADAYVAAASLDVLGEDERFRLLTRAIELAPDHSGAHFELAELLRLRSLAADDAGSASALIEQASATWSRGYAVASPPAQLAWALTSRGLIDVRSGELRPDRRLDDLWSAVLWLERAVVEQDDAYPWMHLSRVLRTLNLEANALEVSARAADLAPYDDYVLMERAWVLLRAGHFPEVIELVEPAREHEPSVLVELVAGLALGQAARFEEAWGVAQGALAREGEPESETAQVALLLLSAECLYGLGRYDEELAIYRRIIDMAAGDPDSRSERALALFRVGAGEGDHGLLGEAVAAFSELVADEFERDRWTYFYGGLARLGVGDPEGADWARRGIELCYSSVHFDEVDEQLERLKLHASPEVLTGLRDFALARRATTGLPSAAEELEGLGADEVARTAVGMSRARIRRQDGDWLEALAELDALWDALDGPTRSALAGATAQPAIDSASAWLGAGYADPASSLLSQCAALAARAEAPQLEASAQTLLVLAWLRRGEAAEADAALVAALASWRAAGVRDPAEEIWARCGVLARNAEELWAVDDLSWAAADDGAAADHRLVVARHLAGLAEEGAGSEPEHDPRPVIKLGEALIPADTGPEWSLWSRYMPAMRERLHEESGIRVPGGRFQAGHDVTPSEYSVLVAGLQARREVIPMAASTSATDEPIAHVVDGLEAVLRRNLDQFVALDDVLALVHEDDAAARLDPLARLRMAAITRALARDRVPLTAVALMVEHANAEGTAQDAIERVRLAMWDRLPGNDPAHRRVPLPESLATEIDAVFDLERGRLAATASPLDAEAVEQKLATWVAKTEPTTLTIVVDRENQRRVIQRLVRRYHPDVPVLVRAGTREAMELTEQSQPSEELHA